MNVGCDPAVLARLRHAERRRCVGVVVDHVVPHVRGAVALGVLRLPVVQRRGVAVAVVAVHGVVQPAIPRTAARPDEAAARVVREGRVLQRDRDGHGTAVVVADLERLVRAVGGVIRVRRVVVVVRPVAEREPVDDPVPGRGCARDAARAVGNRGARLAFLRPAVALGAVVPDARAARRDVEVDAGVVTRRAAPAARAAGARRRGAARIDGRARPVGLGIRDQLHRVVRAGRPGATGIRRAPPSRVAATRAARGSLHERREGRVGPLAVLAVELVVDVRAVCAGADVDPIAGPDAPAAGGVVQRAARGVLVRARARVGAGDRAADPGGAASAAIDPARSERGRKRIREAGGWPDGDRGREALPGRDEGRKDEK